MVRNSPTAVDVWPVWVIGGWGVGLALHAWAIFGQRSITESDIQREMRRHGPSLA